MTVTIRPTEINAVYGNDDNGDPVWNLRKPTVNDRFDADQLISVPYTIAYNPSTNNQGTSTLTINFNQTSSPINFFDITGEDLISTDVVLNGPDTFQFIVKADPTTINGLTEATEYTQMITAVEELVTATARWYELEVTPAGHNMPATSPAALPFQSQDNTKEVQVALRTMRIDADGDTVEGLLQYPEGGFVATPMTDNDAQQVYPSGPISSTQITDTQVGKLTFVINSDWNREVNGIDATFAITAVDTSLKTKQDNPVRFSIELTTT